MKIPNPTPRHLKLGIAAGVTALLLGGTAAPAFASGATASRAAAPATASARSLEVIRAACNYEIDRRLFILTIADNWIASARHLTDEQRSSMTTSNVSVLEHLTGVNRPAVNAAGTTDALKAACEDIRTDNRVYAVVIPQLLLTIRNDQLADAVERLTALSAEKAAAGHDTTQVDAWLADAGPHVTSSQASVASVTVDSFNADPDGARAAFDSAQSDIAAAFGDVVQTFRALMSM